MVAEQPPPPLRDRTLPTLCVTRLGQNVTVTEEAYPFTGGWKVEDFGSNLMDAILKYDTVAFWCFSPTGALVIARYMRAEECLECKSDDGRNH